MAGGSSIPISRESVEQGLHFHKQDFRRILEHGPELYVRAINDALERLGVRITDVDMFVPHQVGRPPRSVCIRRFLLSSHPEIGSDALLCASKCATRTKIGALSLQANGNVRQIGSKLGFVPERIFMNFERVGNTANASIPLCIDEMVQSDALPDDALVLGLAAESTKWLYGVMALRWRRKRGAAAGVRQRAPAAAASASASLWSLLRRVYALLVWTLISTFFAAKKRLFRADAKARTE